VTFEEMLERDIRVVRVRSASGEDMDLAEVIGYIDQPSLSLRHANGANFHWVAQFCAIVSDEEAAAYYKRRAEYLENELAKVKPEQKEPGASEGEPPERGL